MTSKDLRVEDLMSTALITARPNQSISHAEFDMDLANVRHILVTDEANKLVGVLSSRDVLKAFGTQSSFLLSAIMTTDMKTVTPDEKASAALETLIEFKIGCLPVVGQEGELVGIVTETDFLRLAHEVLTT